VTVFVNAMRQAVVGSTLDAWQRSDVWSIATACVNAPPQTLPMASAEWLH